jgi:hypothetical protein
MAILEFTDVFHVLMTSKAQLVAWTEQMLFIVRGMRVMTLDTLPFGRYLVHALCLGRDYIVMACEANFVGIGGQQFAVIRRVRVVATRAVSVLERRMDKLFFQFDLECGMTGETNGALSPLFQVKIVRFRGRTDRGEHHQSHAESHQAEKIPSFHISHLYFLMI